MWGPGAKQRIFVLQIENNFLLSEIIYPGELWYLKLPAAYELIFSTSKLFVHLYSCLFIHLFLLLFLYACLCIYFICYFPLLWCLIKILIRHIDDLGITLEYKRRALWHSLPVVWIIYPVCSSSCITPMQHNSISASLRVIKLSLVLPMISVTDMNGWLWGLSLPTVVHVGAANVFTTTQVPSPFRHCAFVIRLWQECSIICISMHLQVVKGLQTFSFRCYPAPWQSLTISRVHTDFTSVQNRALWWAHN